MGLSTREGTLQLSVRVAVACGSSLGFAQWLDLPYPRYAMFAAIVVTDLSPQQTRTLGWRRVAGTILGAVVGGAAAAWLPPAAGSVALAVMLALALCHLLGLKGAASITAIVCSLVVLDYHDDPWRFALARLVETLLGVAVALGVSFVPKLFPVEQSKS